MLLKKAMVIEYWEDRGGRASLCWEISYVPYMDGQLHVDVSCPMDAGNWAQGLCKGNGCSQSLSPFLRHQNTLDKRKKDLLFGRNSS